MDRLGLLGVTAEQIRQKQRDARLKGQQSLFSQARTPEQLSGMAIASLIGSLGRGLFGKASQAEQNAQLREQIYGETDFTDVNSILGSADVLRSTDPKAAAQYELFAKNYEAEQQAAALAAEDRQRELLGTRLDLAQKGVDLQQAMKDLNAVDAPKPRDYGQLTALVEGYVTADPAKRLDSLQEGTGKGFWTRETSLDKLTPLLIPLTASIMQENPSLKVDEAFAQAGAAYSDMVQRGKEPAKTKATGSDAYSDLDAVPEDREVMVEGKTKMLRPVGAFQTRADINKQRTKINEVSNAIGKIDNQLANFEKAMMRSRRGATPENQNKVAELKARRDKLVQQLKLFNEGYLVPKEE